MLLVVAFTLIPVAGVAEQALVTAISVTLAVGIAVGSLVGGVSHAFFPDAPEPGREGSQGTRPSRETASWIALRGTLVVMPVFVLALTDPSFYLAAIMKTPSSRAAGGFDRHPLGRSGTGGIDPDGGGDGPGRLVRPVAVAQPVDAAAVDDGGRAVGRRAALPRQATAFPPVFWNNALITMLILLGPAIEDSASGTGVLGASAVRVGLFVGVALYAWATVWLLERWRASRSEALFFHHAEGGERHDTDQPGNRLADHDDVPDRAGDVLSLERPLRGAPQASRGSAVHCSPVSERC
jgi:hypothetical protein